MAAAARTCFQIRAASVHEMEVSLPGWTHNLSIAASGVRLELEQRLLPLVSPLPNMTQHIILHDVNMKPVDGAPRVYG